MDNNTLLVTLIIALIVFVSLPFLKLRRDKKIKNKNSYVEKKNSFKKSPTDFLDQQCVGKNLIFTEASIFSFDIFSTKTFKYVAIKKGDDITFIFFSPSELKFHPDGVYVYMQENSLDEIFVYGAGYLDLEKIESTLEVSFYGTSFCFFTPKYAFLLLLKEKLEDEAKKKNQKLRIFIDGEKKLSDEEKFYSINKVISLIIKK